MSLSPRDAQPLLEQIGTAAIVWDAARRDVLRLKQARNAFRCEVRSDAEYDENGRETYPGDLPCWAVQTRPEGDPLRIEHRCDACQKNRVVHLQVKKAIAACGGKLQRLRRLIAKTQPPRDAQPPDREIT